DYNVAAQQRDRTRSNRKVAGFSWRKTMLRAGMGLVFVWAAAGCHKTSAQGANTAEQSADPAANGNMAPVNGVEYVPASAPAPARVLGQRTVNESQQQAEEYAQQPPAPVERRSPGGDQGYPSGPAYPS